LKFDVNSHDLYRYNALLQYKEKDYDVVLQHESVKEDGLELGKVHLGAYYRHGKYQAGLRGSFLN